MEERESRRASKTVNYAEAVNVSDDDDFAISSLPSKKQKENCEKSVKIDGNREKNTNGCDRDKRDREKREDKEKRDHKDHKHEKEKYRDHSRDKKEKNRDSDKNRNEKDKYKERHSKERTREGEREKKNEHRSKHDTDREKKDRRHDKDKKHDSERSVYKEKQDKTKSEESSDSEKKDLNSLNFNDHPMTSTQKSPSRMTPKPRLTIEEKMFQRELEAALTVSRLETATDPATFEDKPLEKESKADTQGIDQVEPQASSKLANVNDAPETNHRTSPRSNSVSQHNAEEKTTSPASSQDESLTGKNPAKNLLEVEKLEKDKRSAKVNKIEDPQPSTSTGITSKRPRKRVVFKEDTDSDSFDGFEADEDADSDFSEGSDFAPSPKKKRGKETRTSKNNKSPASKTTVKTPDRSKSHSKKSIPTRTMPVSAAKENTAPQSPSTLTAHRIPSPVIAHRSPTVVKAKTDNSPSIMLSPQAVKTSKTVSSPSSPGNSRVSVGLVKTPFRSPLLQSPGSSSSSSVPKSSLGTNKNTGLRIGLSRRANLKPLHPSRSGK